VHNLIVVTGSEIPVETLRSWAAKSWAEIVFDWLVRDSGLEIEASKEHAEKNFRAGTLVSGVKKSTAGMVSYLALYLGNGKGKAKEYQHEIPEC